MAASQASEFFHCIRTLALRQSDATTDGNLLDLYVQQKEEAAFEALVRRHGRMVLGVCRRILGNSHDAEDAFQATFLVLVRKAAIIRPSGMVGNWLYGVAHRTALEARRSANMRRTKEAQVAPRTEMPEDALAHLRPLFDQELPRLPDKYRAVLVLCDLEGRTRKEAAQQLALPEGTIASRLSRARIILAKRLTRHGVTLSGGALAAAIAQEAASASAPLSLVFATVKAATAYAAGPGAAAAAVSAPVAALTEGVLKTMLLSKLKIGVLLAVIGVAGTGWGNYRTWAKDQPAMQGGQQQVAQADLKQDEKPVQGNPIRSSDDLRGKWTGEKNGVKVDLTFSGEQAPWQAHWQVAFAKARKPENPQQSPTVGVDIGAALRCVADVKAGRLSLYLPAYLGDNKEIKQSSHNGLRPVGQVQRGPRGTIQLRLIPTGYENLVLQAYDYPAVEGLILHRVAETPKEGKKASDEKKPPDQDQAEQILDMVRKGYQARQASKGKVGERPNKEALDLYSEAFLKAFQISSQIAKTRSKKTHDDKISPNQDQAKRVLEMVLKGFQAYQASKGKEGERPNKEALDLYSDAFLKAFQISSEIAKARGKAQAKLTPEDQAVLDSCGPAFLQAYERANILKKALEEQKHPGSKGNDKAIEALDVFLKAGKEFEQAVKQHAKAQAVQQARREIENAVTKVEKSTHDRRTELETLEEIERVVQQMKKKLQERKDGK